ncbi:MAG: redoxin domain-containing protein [Opitutales bacterium]|jgi:peroxiredoxin
MRLPTLLLALIAPLVASAEAEIGKPAPDFTLTTIDGKTVKLADLKGKVVVLEWFNPGCPYSGAKFYKPGKMQDIQRKAAELGATWLTVSTGRANSAADLAKLATSWKIPSTVAVDPEGTVGRAYGAKTTPHCFVISAEGALVYKGAIDSNTSSKHAEDAGYRNHVLAALEDLKAGRAVSQPMTKPYGCGVKY